MQFRILKGKSDSRHQISTRLLSVNLFLLLLFADVPMQMTWMAPSSLTSRRKEREQYGALSFVANSPPFVVSVSFCRLLLI